MTYAAGYDFDVFISYARVDDIGPIGAGDGWVSEFVYSLERVLASRLGERPRIYFDRRDVHANHELEEILSTVTRSATFVSIVSPAYVRRDFTQRELAKFASCDFRHRLFSVEYLPLDEDESYPSPLDARHRVQFWDRDGIASVTPKPLQNKEKLFDKIHDVADQIRLQLEGIKCAETKRSSNGDAVDPVSSAPSGRLRNTVFLAQTTEDLDDERAQVRRHLEQFGFVVLPHGELPGGGADFRSAAEAAVREADLYIHLLGSRAGRSPADLPEGYGSAQFNLAVANRKSMLLWRNPELDLDKVSDARQRALLSNEHVVAGTLQELTEEALRRLTAPTATEAAPATRSFAFISAIRNDHEAARVVEHEFEARNMPVAIQLREGTPQQIREDLTTQMGLCDVVIFIYGEAPIQWVRAHMAQFAKAKALVGEIATAGQRPPYVPALFEGPPDKEQVGDPVRLPGLRHVRFLEGWSPERIRAVIKEMLT
jgi:hypothetical protein